MMPAILAEETLREKGHALGEKAIYQLTLAATGSQEEAEEAYTKAVDRALRAGRTPEAL